MDDLGKLDILFEHAGFGCCTSFGRFCLSCNELRVDLEESWFLVRNTLRMKEIQQPPPQQDVGPRSEVLQYQVLVCRRTLRRYQQVYVA